MRHLNEENHVCKGIKMQKDSVGGNQISCGIFWNREQVIFVMC